MSPDGELSSYSVKQVVRIDSSGFHFEDAACQSLFSGDFH